VERGSQLFLLVVSTGTRLKVHDGTGISYRSGGMIMEPLACLVVSWNRWLVGSKNTCYTRNNSELCLFNGARHHTIIIGGKVSAGVGICRRCRQVYPVGPGG